MDRCKGVLNDSSSSRGNRTKCMDMSHNIMASLLLLYSRDVKLLGGQRLGYEHLLSNSDERKCTEIHTRLFSICSIASSEMGRPSSFSAFARFSHSFRHVVKRIYGIIQLSFIWIQMELSYCRRKQMGHLLACITTGKQHNKPTVFVEEYLIYLDNGV